VIAEKYGDLEAAIIPPEAVTEFWPDIRFGVAAAVENSPGDTSEETILRSLFDGTAKLVILASEASAVGGLIVEDLPSERGKWLNIAFMFSDGLTSLSRLFSFVESYAQKNDYLGVKWVTTNDRAPVLAKRRGYQRRLVEYVKEF
jgi:hypothetical protein